MGWIHKVAVPLVAALLGGCVATHFSAVQATGAIGAKIGAESETLAALPGSCKEAKIVTTAWNCATVAGTASSLQKVASILQAYASTLSDLANKADPTISEKSLPTAANLEWIGTQASAVQTAARAIAGVILGAWSTGYKEAELKKAIRDANPHVQTVAKAMSGALEAERDSLQSAHDALVIQATLFQADAQKSATQATTEAVRAQEVALVAALSLDGRIADLERRMQALQELEATVTSFAKAHQALFDQADSLDKAEVLATVTRIIAGVSGG